VHILAVLLYRSMTTWCIVSC